MKTKLILLCALLAQLAGAQIQYIVISTGTTGGDNGAVGGAKINTNFWYLQNEILTNQTALGTITTTNNPLDVAINGNGFFVLSDNGTTTYSRNGQFSLNNQGYLVNSAGANVTGFPASASGGVTTGTPVAPAAGAGFVTPESGRGG